LCNADIHFSLISDRIASVVAALQCDLRVSLERGLPTRCTLAYGATLVAGMLRCSAKMRVPQRAMRVRRGAMPAHSRRSIARSMSELAALSFQN
jgi:hypothetical protein